MNIKPPESPPDALLCAAHEALVRNGSLSAALTLEQELAHPVHGRVLHAYAASLKHGQKPYPPPAHVRPCVIEPAPLLLDNARTPVPRARCAAVDLKRRAANDWAD